MDDYESAEIEGEVLVAKSVSGVRFLYVRMPGELDDEREADMSGVREVKETGLGVIGRPDPVVWQAMQDVMSAAAEHRSVSRSLREARGNGQVCTSLALARSQMRLEKLGNEAVAVCARLGGDNCAIAALHVVEQGGMA